MACKGFLSFCLLLNALLYATDYSFIDREHPWHLEGDYSVVRKATFRHRKDASLNYREGEVRLYYSRPINTYYTLSYQIGEAGINLGWKKNPRFKGNRYDTTFGSIALISTHLQRWRWIAKVGASVDSKSFCFGPTGVYDGLAWGRYHISETLGLHVGLGGYVGIKNHYVLPIFGLDWTSLPKWRLQAVFPLVLSLEYFWTSHLSASLAVNTFGGPYRYPRRAHGGIGRFDNAIFEIYSKGLEIDLKYRINRCSASVGCGWNFGGWILTKNAHNESGKYFKFNAAPYAQGRLTLTF
jgi:hypothetical protein